MKTVGLRFWAWVLGTFFILMMPIALLVLLGVHSRQPEIGVGASIVWGAYVLVWPLIIAAVFAFIWIGYPVVFWLFWRYLLAMEWVTGAKAGTWFSKLLAKDQFLKRSRPGTINYWLHQKVLAHERKLGRDVVMNTPDA